MLIGSMSSSYGAKPICLKGSPRFLSLVLIPTQLVSIECRLLEHGSGTVSFVRAIIDCHAHCPVNGDCFAQRLRSLFPNSSYSEHSDMAPRKRMAHDTRMAQILAHLFLQLHQGLPSRPKSCGCHMSGSVKTHILSLRENRMASALAPLFQHRDQELCLRVKSWDWLSHVRIRPVCRVWISDFRCHYRISLIIFRCPFRRESQ